MRCDAKSKPGSVNNLIEEMMMVMERFVMIAEKTIDGSTATFSR